MVEVDLGFVGASQCVGWQCLGFADDELGVDDLGFVVRVWEPFVAGWRIAVLVARPSYDTGALANGARLLEPSGGTRKD